MISNFFTFCPSSSCEVESEKVVVAVVAGGTTGHQLENLREVQGLSHISVNDKLAAHERDNSIVDRGLRIKSGNFVLH